MFGRVIYQHGDASPAVLHRLQLLIKLLSLLFNILVNSFSSIIYSAIILPCDGQDHHMNVCFILSGILPCLGSCLSFEG